MGVFQLENGARSSEANLTRARRFEVVFFSFLLQDNCFT